MLVYDALFEVLKCESMLLLPADQNTENIINSKNIDELLTSQLQAEKCAHIYKIVLRT